MATININAIQDFFEAGLNYCANKIKEITPIIPYSYLHFKQAIYLFNKAGNLSEVQQPLKSKYIKNAPAYVLADATYDNENWDEGNEPGKISNGVYYIVLADLVGSTKYLASYGNEKAAARIISFVQAGVESFINAEKVNKAYFLKEVGDSVLFIFSHVHDLVQWHQDFRQALNKRSSLFEEPLEIRTCVHLGEVCLHDDNPLCLSVSETFKMEKLISNGKMVFSEAAACVAAPSLKGKNYAFQTYQKCDLVGNMQELLVQEEINKAPS